MRLSLKPITHARFFFQLYEIDDNPARREFLDELFAFMQKRGESQIRIIVTTLSLLLLQQKLVWVSRLGWPRTKISETHFFPESISKLIIWSGDLVMSWLGDKWKEGNIGPSIIPSDRRPGEIGPVFVLPMMSYADNEAWGNTLARTQCALHMCVFRRPPPDAPRHHLSSQRASQIIHTRLYLDPTAHLDH